MKGDLTFFISGTIQGSRYGIESADQSYRSVLQNVILKYYPNSIIYCPLEILRKRFSATLDQAVTAYKQETTTKILESSKYSSTVSEIRSAFADIVKLAARADVLVAYLPGHEASMGTAMEMWSAYSNDRVLITISSMFQNLAVVSTSALVIPSIEDFDRFLASGGLESLINKV